MCARQAVLQIVHGGINKDVWNLKSVQQLSICRAAFYLSWLFPNN